MTPVELKTRSEKLRRMASKAVMARDAFEAALEKAKDDEKNWAKLCDQEGCDPDCDASDWMC